MCRLRPPSPHYVTTMCRATRMRASSPAGTPCLLRRPRSIAAARVVAGKALERFPAAPLREALEALHEQHISAAPVVDMDGVLVGALNLHDLHQAGIG